MLKFNYVFPQNLSFHTPLENLVRVERLCYELCDTTEDTNPTQRSPFTKHTQAAAWKVFIKLKVMQLSKRNPCGKLSNSLESKSSFWKEGSFQGTGLDSWLLFWLLLAERWGNLPRVLSSPSPPRDGHTHKTEKIWNKIHLGWGMGMNGLVAACLKEISVNNPSGYYQLRNLFLI